MPEYLAQTTYKVPLDPANGVFQYTKDWKGNMFLYYEAHSREGESFKYVMGGVMANQAGWLDIFPHELVLMAVSSGTIWNNSSRDIRNCQSVVSAGRPEVVGLSKCPDPMNKLGYDFFTQQPVKGLRVYYMHGVLHDCTLLIHDHITPRALAHPHTTAYDLVMMVMVAGMERTEVHLELLQSERYKLARSWRSPLAM
ncbi:uncharacterized protein ATNIH1004_011413 [Aspergillus tanneri]|uniref:Uncharacterized protein n=1 Tax=Aspergillus tanneri TaxID=1220188 RepID=A0A5M9M6N8_9EURO|nr:uncharacterized protein ATNIH1004_011413 [Aspergillus tanneri]KAA8642468.1 hypothetical protein ATNIH1004_011413 [Aspergillus tanneri]